MKRMHEAGESRRSRARVLIVDDDESMCDLLGLELGSRGFTSVFETAPERVLDALESNDVDVVAVSYTHLDVYKRQW